MRARACVCVCVGGGGCTCVYSYKNHIDLALITKMQFKTGQRFSSDLLLLSVLRGPVHKK